MDGPHGDPVFRFTLGERWFPQSINGEPDTVYWRQQDGWTCYWLLYTKDRSPLPWRGAHDWDWEVVMFRGAFAALSQHGQADLRSTHELRTQDNRPVIYPALWKHANHWTPGLHHTHGIDFDIALGNGRTLEHYRLLPAPNDGWADRMFREVAAPGRTTAWRNPTAWSQRGR